MKTIFSDSFKEELKRKDTTLRLTKYFLKSDIESTYTKQELVSLSGNLLSSVTIHEVAGIWENNKDILKLYIPVDSLDIKWKLIYVLYQNSFGNEDVAFVLVPNGTVLLETTNNLEILGDLELAVKNLIEVGIPDVESGLEVPCSLDTKFLESDGIEKGVSLFLSDSDSRIRNKKDTSLITLDSFKKYVTIKNSGDDYVGSERYITTTGEIYNKGRVERRVDKIYIDVFGGNYEKTGVENKKVILNIPVNGQEVKIVGLFHWEEYLISEDGIETKINEGVSSIDYLTEGTFHIKRSLDNSSDFDFSMNYLKKTLYFKENPVIYQAQSMNLYISLGDEDNGITSNYIEIHQEPAKFEISISKNTTYEERGRDLYLLDWNSESKEVFTIDNNYNINPDDLIVKYGSETISDLFEIKKEISSEDDSKIIFQIVTLTDNNNDYFLPKSMTNTNFDDLENLISVIYNDKVIYQFFVVQKREISGLDVYKKEGNIYKLISNLDINSENKKEVIAFTYQRNDKYDTNFFKIINSNSELEISKLSGTIQEKSVGIDDSEGTIISYKGNINSVNNTILDPIKVLRVADPNANYDISDWRIASDLFILNLSTAVLGQDPVIEVVEKSITFSTLNSQKISINTNCRFECKIVPEFGNNEKFNFRFYGQEEDESFISDSETFNGFLYIEPTKLVYTERSCSNVATLSIINLEGSRSIKLDIPINVSKYIGKLSISPSSNNKFDFIDGRDENYIFLGDDSYKLMYNSERSIGIKLDYTSGAILEGNTLQSNIANTFISEGRYNGTEVLISKLNKAKKLYPTSLIAIADIAGLNEDGGLLENRYSNHIEGLIFEKRLSPKINRGVNSNNILLSYNSGSSYDYSFESLYPITESNISVIGAVNISYMLFTIGADPGNYRYTIRVIAKNTNDENTSVLIGSITITSMVSRNNLIERLEGEKYNSVNDFITALTSSQELVNKVAGVDSLTLNISQRGKTTSGDIIQEGDIIGSDSDIAAVGEIREYIISATGSYDFRISDTKNCSVDINSYTKKLTVNFFSKYPNNGSEPGIFKLEGTDSDEKANKYIELSRERESGFVATFIRRVNGEEKERKIETYKSIKQIGFPRGILYRSPNVINNLFVNYGTVRETIDKNSREIYFTCGIFNIDKKIELNTEGSPLSEDNIALLGIVSDDGRIIPATLSECGIKVEIDQRNKIPVFNNDALSNHNIHISFSTNFNIEDKTFRFRVGSGDCYIILEITQKGQGYSVNPTGDIKDNSNLIFHASGKYRHTSYDPSVGTLVEYLDEANIPFTTNLPDSIIRDCIKYVRINSNNSFEEIEGRANYILQSNGSSDSGDKYILKLSLNPNIHSNNYINGDEYLIIHDNQNRILWRGKIYQGFCVCGIVNPLNRNTYYIGEISTNNNPINLLGGRSSEEDGRVILSMKNLTGDLQVQHLEITEISNGSVNLQPINMETDELLKKYSVGSDSWSVLGEGGIQLFPDTYLTDYETKLSIEDDVVSNQVPFVENIFKVVPEYYHTQFNISVSFDVTIPYGDLEDLYFTTPFSVVYNKPEARDAYIEVESVPEPQESDVNLIELSADKGSLSLKISSNTEYEVKVSDTALDWLKQIETDSNSEYNYVFDVTENKNETREGYITIITTDLDQPQATREILIRQLEKSSK